MGDNESVPQRNTDTATQILDVAERLTQSRGFNGFSYADVATEMGISKAALHYHFSSKAELGHELIERYTARFFAALDGLSTDSASRRLEGYAELYLGVLQQERMCLCGMLAAEYSTLPEPMRTAVLEFFDRNEVWLSGVLAQGLRDGEMEFSGSADVKARVIISTLEGAMLVARLHGGTEQFREISRDLLASLAARQG